MRTDAHPLRRFLRPLVLELGRAVGVVQSTSLCRHYLRMRGTHHIPPLHPQRALPQASPAELVRGRTVIPALHTRTQKITLGIQAQMEREMGQELTHHRGFQCPTGPQNPRTTLRSSILHIRTPLQIHLRMQVFGAALARVRERALELETLGRPGRSQAYRQQIFRRLLDLHPRVRDLVRAAAVAQEVAWD